MIKLMAFITMDLPSQIYIVDEIGTVDLGLGDLDHSSRVVGLPRLIDE
jgi:hypothetical protein